MMLKFYKSMLFWLLFSYVDGDGGGAGDGGSGDGAGDGDSGSGDDGDGKVEAKWPDNWREEMAGDDEKALTQLGRYATPNEVWNKARSLEQRMSSGELKNASPFPEEGTDEQKTAWRAENGIPAEAKYDLSLPEGMVIGDTDQPIIDGFMEYAHANNMPTAAVNASVNWYFENQASLSDARNQMDLEIQEKNTDVLRGEWGNDYRQNVNRIDGLLSTAPEEVKEAIMGARLPDGTPFGSDVGVLKFLVQLAHEVNPATTLVPGAGANVMDAIADEISSIEKLMGDRNSEYYKGPEAEKMQERYRQLVEARDKSKAA